MSRRKELFSQLIRGVPHLPGVYMMKNSSGEIIYVGKAKDLRKRIHNYFAPHPNDNRASVPFLRREISALETIVTGNEKEAIILERTLVRQYKPRYNIDLKDDKNFLSVRVDMRHPYPRFELVRRQKNDGARYFGPFSAAKEFRSTLRFVNGYFKIRVCKDTVFKSRKYPCLWFHMHRCDAPCVYKVSQEEYKKNVERAIKVLRGGFSELLAEVTQEMQKAAEIEAFERAAYLRDLSVTIRKTLEDRQIILGTEDDIDALGFMREGDSVAIFILNVRGGVLRGGRPFIFKGQDNQDSEIISEFLDRYYEELLDLPREVLLPEAAFEEIQLNDVTFTALSEIIEERARFKIQFRIPKRGDMKKLIDIAESNAREHLLKSMRDEENIQRILNNLKKLLHLKKIPNRIECYDISLFAGTYAVGSRAVVVNGKPETNLYRRYRIKTVGGTDDYAMMREILLRRLNKLENDPAPDLIVVDGGTGQLNSARTILTEGSINADIELAALAKERVLTTKQQNESVEHSDERVFIENRVNPIILKKPTAEKHLLVRLRDEAHRFAITYQRELRKRMTLKSSLIDIPGVGETTARRLLKHFGSLKRIRDATEVELASVEGVSATAAKIIFNYFHSPEVTEG